MRSSRIFPVISSRASKELGFAEAAARNCKPKFRPQFNADGDGFSRSLQFPRSSLVKLDGPSLRDLHREPAAYSSVPKHGAEELPLFSRYIQGQRLARLQVPGLY